MNNPLISIIVPVYNVEKYLRPCLDSILSQTYMNWEAILVDDGSKDNSGMICDEYAQKDSRFIVVHKENAGVAQARITGFENSKGELITFVDSDDYVTIDYLEKLSQPIINDSMDMVSCNYFDVSIETNGITSGKKVMEGFFCGTDLLNFIGSHYFYDKSCRGFGMTNMLWAKMVRREYVEQGLKCGVGMWFGEDQVALFYMLYRIKKLSLISNRLYYYVHYKGQATQRYNYSLWDSLIKMFNTYQDIDSKKIAQKGLRIRTWLYICRTIHDKMIPSGISINDFNCHLSDAGRHPYMQEFYRPLCLGFGWKNEIKYWMLKMKLFRIYYSIYAGKAKYTL